jgi:hypothetical protein
MIGRRKRGVECGRRVSGGGCGADELNLQSLSQSRAPYRTLTTFLICLI